MIMSSHNLTFMIHNSEFINSEFVSSYAEFISCNSDNLYQNVFTFFFNCQFMSCNS